MPLGSREDHYPQKLVDQEVLNSIVDDQFDCLENVLPRFGTRVALWNDGEPVRAVFSRDELQEMVIADLHAYLESGDGESVVKRMVSSRRRSVGLSPLGPDDEVLTEQNIALFVDEQEAMQQRYQDILPYRVSDNQVGELTQNLIELGVLPRNSGIGGLRICVVTRETASGKSNMIHISGDLVFDSKEYPELAACDDFGLKYEFSYALHRAQAGCDDHDGLSLFGMVGGPGRQKFQARGRRSSVELLQEWRKMSRILSQCNKVMQQRSSRYQFRIEDITLVHAIKTMLEAVELPE
ncbi:MAG: hypothetical protein U9Q67_00500 [Patescibacteria group bacterium]|nr:hypothetical protein [Patescibacteria group bacterium]